MDHTLACLHPLVVRTGTEKWGESGDKAHRDYVISIHISVQSILVKTEEGAIALGSALVFFCCCFCFFLSHRFAGSHFMS